ncbi:unnamed protein product [Somion occarium]|uniref:Uncharacterized protein n=1 Tax=Somion occarium TaxID=3059160 RepID=A0ABP1DXS2_9APHY
MSIRQRIPFKFTEDTQDEDIHILDEQEQEELIQKLKEESDARNAQYRLLLQTVLGLSATLQLVYLLKSHKEPPIAALFPGSLSTPFTPIPILNLWITLNLFYHANLSLHLMPSSHPIRQFLQRAQRSSHRRFIPLSYPILYVLSAIPVLLSFILETGPVDVAWWLITPTMIYFVHSAQKWIAQETDGIRNLENLRYDARGA